MNRCIAQHGWDKGGTRNPRGGGCVFVWGLNWCVVPQGNKGEIQAMYQEWPFFQSTIDLIEMVCHRAPPHFQQPSLSGPSPPCTCPAMQTLSGAKVCC